MKRILLLYICMMQCLFAFCKKRALLVGVGHYPKESGWQEISSVNDIDLFKEVFPSNDMQVLLDENATHKNIRKAFASLRNKIHKGDTILIHFSCHGQQMLPLTDNEEVDNLDEALVPFDAYSTKSDNYDGENHLRDDEMNDLLNSIRTAAGTNGLVLLTIDACFSDSMDKSSKKDKTKYRGGGGIFGANTLSNERVKDLLTHRTNEETATILKRQDLSDILILSACKSFQRNKEVVIDGIGYGSLSYAMYSSYKKFGMSDLHKWLDGVYDVMRKKAFTQTPKIKTTLDYSFPKPSYTKNAHNDFEEDTNEFRYPTTILSLSIVGLLIIVLVWMKLRNKL